MDVLALVTLLALMGMAATVGELIWHNPWGWLLGLVPLLALMIPVLVIHVRAQRPPDLRS